MSLPPSSLPLNWEPIPRPFFTAPPELVAPKLLGKLLARHTESGWLAGRIVEVEAYLGPHIMATPDPAAHSFRGITDRNRVMFGPPGYAYVYFIYGMYYCVNVTCEPEGLAGCILIRALEPVLGQTQMAINRKLSVHDADGRLTEARLSKGQLTGGPGRLCQALAITRSEDNGLDLLDPHSPLQLLQDDVPAQEIEITRRIGIRHAAHLPLRFALVNHPCVSRIPKSPTPV